MKFELKHTEREADYDVDLKREDLIDAKRSFRQQILDTLFSGARDPWINTVVEQGNCGRLEKVEEIFDGNERLGCLFQTKDGLRLNWRW